MLQFWIHKPACYGGINPSSDISGKLYIAGLTSWEEYIGAKKGKEEWAKNNDQEKTKVESLDEFETKGKWVLDRLSGLVDPPTKELWGKWYPKQNK